MKIFHLNVLDKKRPTDDGASGSRHKYQSGKYSSHRCAVANQFVTEIQFELHFF